MNKISLGLSLVCLSLAACNVQFVPETDAAADAAPVVDSGTTPPPPADAGVTPPPVDSGTTPPPPVDAGPQCQTGRTSCGGACCELATDRNNCGACGNVCMGTATCVAGTCVLPTPPPADAGTTPPPTCYAPYAPCGGACVNLQTNVANCGYCGRACATGQTCTAGSCVTPTPPPPVCNPASCPMITNANRVCNSGACGFTCFSSYGNCNGSASDGCEAPLTTNLNCGACGHTCTGGSNCQDGTCVATPPPATRYLRAHLPGANYLCTWDLNADPASNTYCSTTPGGQLYVGISGPYWPGNHIRIGVATANPITATSSVTWVMNGTENNWRTARQMGFDTLQIEQAGASTQYLLDTAVYCIDVCHPSYARGYREVKLTVPNRSGASVCPTACDAP